MQDRIGGKDYKRRDFRKKGGKYAILGGGEGKHRELREMAGNKRKRTGKNSGIISLNKRLKLENDQSRAVRVTDDSSRLFCHTGGGEGMRKGGKSEVF